MRVLPDDQIAGALTVTRPGPTASPPGAAAEVPLTGRFTVKHVDISDLVQNDVTDSVMKLIPGRLRQAAQPLRPLMDHVRRMSTAVQAEFSLDFGSIHLTFTAGNIPTEGMRLTSPRATEQSRQPTEATVECAELTDYVIDQVKHRATDDAYR